MVYGASINKPSKYEIFKGYISDYKKEVVLGLTALTLAASVGYSTNAITTNTTLNRLSSLEQKIEPIEEFTGKPLDYTSKIRVNGDEVLDELVLRDNNSAIGYLKDKSGKTLGKILFTPSELSKFVSMYDDETQMSPISKEEAQNLYDIGINTKFITCENVANYSNLIRYANKKPNCK